MIAFRNDRGAVAVPYWDLSVSWARLLATNTVATDAAFAKLCGVDASTMLRGLAVQNADEDLLAAFGDRRDISMSQWAELAPLLTVDEQRALVLDRAALLVGKDYAAPRVAAQLKAAAAKKIEIKPIEVRNRHDKLIATIRPDHRGGFTISVKAMREEHPTYRLDRAKVINEEFMKFIKIWFEDAS